METLFSPVALAIVFGIIYGALPLLLHALYHADKRVVTCPRTGSLAEIRAAVSAGSQKGQVAIHVSSCTLRFKVMGCNEQCLKH